ncbi:hypothetical protein CK224_19980 [Mesorhizobium sp. WSM3862]|nr:hypothetical protein A9K66_25755 [Mesorhizobium sp. AA23]PBB96583.1 hypothetical protein CK224_19980 [Mesorhizobium sp. WSM3862]
MRRPLRLIMFFGHEVNEKVAQKRAARLQRHAGPSAVGQVGENRKNRIGVALGTLVTESAHKVIVVEK